MTETDPKYARAWLASLPLADSAETGRKIYQALYTLNRLEAGLAARFELMELYGPPVRSVCAGLQPYLVNQVPPLATKKRRLAEFLRRLHVEMAYGYKLCLHGLRKTHLRIGQRQRLLRCTERALFHLGEVLLRSYVVYMPYPDGIWREIHELYRLAEAAGLSAEPLPEEGEAASAPTIRSQYVRALLLGLADPYQLPQGMVQHVQAFLGRWGETAALATGLAAASPIGYYLVNPDADAPAQPFPARLDNELDRSRLRTLNVLGLVGAVRGFVARIEKGDRVEPSELGVDCPESPCLDFLRRLARLWGRSARRRYGRREQRSWVFVCSGIEAVHFFVHGQQPFEPLTADRLASLVDFSGLDRAEEHALRPQPEPDRPETQRAHRLDRWRIRDIGPNGMALVRRGGAQIAVRVGDLLGVQQSPGLGRWQAAVVRWLRNPEMDSIELGVELLGPSVVPVAVRRLGRDGQAETPYGLALKLPADPLLRKPATLAVACGLFIERRHLELLEADGTVRRIRPLRLLERTGAFEQFVYADAAR